MLASTADLFEDRLFVCVKVACGLVEAEKAGDEEVKSKPGKAKAKPAKKPVLPDSVKAIQKVDLLAEWPANIVGLQMHVPRPAVCYSGGGAAEHCITVAVSLSIPDPN